MPHGNLFDTNPIWTARHHPYDPTIEDAEGFPFTRDVPAAGRIAWEQEPGSAGRFMGCFDEEPNPTFPGRGTWLEFQQGSYQPLLWSFFQGSAVSSAYRFAGARRLISMCRAGIESGVVLLNVTLEITSDGDVDEPIELTVTTDEPGWEWESASPTYDYPVGTIQIVGADETEGWVRARANPATNPIELDLIKNGSNLGNIATLQTGAFVMIQGSLPYTAFPEGPE